VNCCKQEIHFATQKKEKIPVGKVYQENRKHFWLVNNFNIATLAVEFWGELRLANTRPEGKASGGSNRRLLFTLQIVKKAVKE
jgi:hypothetical protein